MYGLDIHRRCLQLGLELFALGQAGRSFLVELFQCGLELTQLILLGLPRLLRRHCFLAVRLVFLLHGIHLPLELASKLSHLYARTRGTTWAQHEPREQAQ